MRVCGGGGGITQQRRRKYSMADTTKIRLRIINHTPKPMVRVYYPKRPVVRIYAYDVVTHTYRQHFSELEPWRTLNHSIIFSFFSVTQNPLCLFILEMRHFAWNLLLGCYTLPVHATRRLVTFILDLTDQSQLEREKCGLKAVANRLSAVRFRTACSNMVVNLLAGYRIYHCN